MSWDDLVQIVATFSSIFNSNFHCRSLDPGKRGCFDMIPKWRRDEMKGCGITSKKPVMRWKEKLVFYRCPTNYRSGFAEELIGLSSKFESGVLPYDGGLLAQPAKMVECLNQIQTLKIEDEIQRTKAQEKQWQKTKLRSR
jgi:hypothetical protein